MAADEGHGPTFFYLLLPTPRKKAICRGTGLMPWSGVEKPLYPFYVLGKSCATVVASTSFRQHQVPRGESIFKAF